MIRPHHFGQCVCVGRPMYAINFLHIFTIHISQFITIHYNSLWVVVYTSVCMMVYHIFIVVKGRISYFSLKWSVALRLIYRMNYVITLYISWCWSIYRKQFWISIYEYHSWYFSSTMLIVIIILIVLIVLIRSTMVWMSYLLLTYLCLCVSHRHCLIDTVSMCLCVVD